MLAETTAKPYRPVTAGIYEARPASRFSSFFCAPTNCRGLLEQVAQLGPAELREPHEDGCVALIVRSHVVGVWLLREQGITRGKVECQTISE